MLYNLQIIVKEKAAFFLILLLFFPDTVYGISDPSHFLLIHNHARSIGRGQTGVADFFAQSAYLINPAALAYNLIPQISLSYLNYDEDFTYQYAGVGIPIQPVMLEFSLFSFHSTPFYDEFEVIGYSVDSSFVLSLASRIIGSLHAGINGKYISRDISNSKYSTLAFDAGLLYGFRLLKFSKRAYDNFMIGFSFRNWGESLEVNGLNEELPTGELAGFNYSPFPALSLLYDLEIEKDYLTHHTGIEVEAFRFITARAGVIGKQNRRSLYSLGLGLNPVINNMACSLDYSVAFSEETVKIHALSLTVYIPSLIQKAEEVSSWKMDNNDEEELEDTVQRSFLIKGEVHGQTVQYIPSTYPYMEKGKKKDLKIAILDYENLLKSKDLEHLSKLIPESISTYLTSGKDLKLDILERETVYSKLKLIAKKIPMDQSDEALKLLGQLLDVDILIKGSFFESENIVRINTKIMDIRANKVINTKRTEGELDENIFSVLDKGSGDILEHIKAIIKNRMSKK